MSIIQDIRDKYAKVTVVLIALALLGFVLTDYFQQKGRGGGGGNSSNSLGSVNGTTIKLDEYNARVAQFEQQDKGNPYAAMQGSAAERAWQNEVMRILVAQEVDKLGIVANKAELGDMLYGANPPADLKQQFTDSTGVYNAALAKQNIEQMLKKGTPDQKASFNAFTAGLVEQRKQEKYMSLFSNSVNVPRWFVEKQNADNSQMAKVSYVRELYTSIPDSTISIDDKSIADYISKHKDEFKQEESRSISYVAFSAAPSKEDSTTAVNKLMDLRNDFGSATDMKNFLAKNGYSNYYDGYISGKTIQIAVKDSIFRTPVGGVYGPYLDGGSFVLAKLEGVKTMPDTVKVRHILIGTQNRDEATAKKLIDSIQTVIKNGTPFDSVVALSEDNPDAESPQQGKYKGGIYDRVTPGQMVPPFNDFIFGNPVGAKGVVKTDFGFHYVEVLSQKGSGAAYKIAYLPSEIISSQTTDNTAQDKANAFFADSRSGMKAFDENYEKKLKATGAQKQIAANIRPADASIDRSGATSRELVRAIYDAKVGEVLKPERLGDSYVVAVVTGAQKEGTMSVAQARPMVEGILRNQKKAEMLKKKVGTITTLEAAGTALGGKPVEVADSLRMDGSSNYLSGERKVLGAAFYPANKGKVVTEAIEGSQGIYVIKVEDVVTTPLANANVAEQRKQLADQQKNQFGNPLGALFNAATIKDKRGERL